MLWELTVECNVFAFHFSMQFLRSPMMRRTKRCTCNPCTVQLVSLPVLFLWFEIDFNITNGTVAAPSCVYLIHRNRIISFGVQFAVRSQHSVRLIFFPLFRSSPLLWFDTKVIARKETNGKHQRPIYSMQKDDSRLRSLQMCHEPMKANGFSLPDLSLHVRKIVSASRLFSFSDTADTDEMEELKNLQCCSQPLLKQKRLRAQRSLKEIINHKMLGSVSVIIAVCAVWNSFLSNL